jgi:serine protease Do
MAQTRSKVSVAFRDKRRKVRGVHRVRWVALLVTTLMLAVGCSGGEADPPAVTEASGSGGEQAEGGAVGALDGVESATIQIIAQGSFVDPELGLQLNAAGAGSGFIIDPSGIAVTNNHVVTGAATLEVIVGGDTDEPVNARVLGASECSDLAVIDLDGEGYPFLEFRADEIDTGLDVYAAGFPLGDPEFTLTRGVVSKAESDGETNWASVDGVIEHDARINPGNSGGPLVDENGHVVAVNYAGDDEAVQYFAIARDRAEEVVGQLREGEDVESIGVNGVALASEEEDISGIWVSSVQTGSPADTALVRPGDIITRMEGLVLATDGTMREYCDILRSRASDDPMAIEVLRYETSEYLEGQLNGRELATSFSFAEEIEEQPTTDAGGGATYAEYTTITDDTGAMSVEVPAEWSDVDGAPYQGADGTQRTDVRAASDLEAFQTGWTTPGMIFTASSQLAQSSDEVAVLDELVEPLSGQCTYAGRQPYEDAAYTGQYDTFTDCGGVGATYVVVGAVPPDRSFVIRVQIQANAERDLEALDRILRTFVVTGEV